MEQFEIGDMVLYVPNHAKSKDSPTCERGIVSKVEGEGNAQKVWVLYSTGDTGALTPIKNLVKQ
jgi:hypothetical protein